MKYFLYGSYDSTDYDIMVIVDKLSMKHENQIMIDEFKVLFSEEFKDKKIDVHLAVIEDGVVVDVSHGTPDEVNNCLVKTYNNFEQKFKLPINKLYIRNNQSEFFYLKVKRVTRFILSFFSREPELRSEIKKALKGDIDDRIKCLKLLDLTKKYTFHKKKDSKEDIYKTIAFQLGQVMALKTKNVEVFSKYGVIRYYPKLQPFLSRKELKEDDYEYLNELLKMFIIVCETSSKLMINKYE